MPSLLTELVGESMLAHIMPLLSSQEASGHDSKCCRMPMMSVMHACKGVTISVTMHGHTDTRTVKVSDLEIFSSAGYGAWWVRHQDASSRGHGDTSTTSPKALLWCGSGLEPPWVVNYALLVTWCILGGMFSKLWMSVEVGRLHGFQCSQVYVVACN
jgi:hypothetical protein